MMKVSEAHVGMFVQVKPAAIGAGDFGRIESKDREGSLLVNLGYAAVTYKSREVMPVTIELVLSFVNKLY